MKSKKYDYYEEVKALFNQITSDKIDIVDGKLVITERVENPEFPAGTKLIRRMCDNDYTTTIIIKPQGANNHEPVVYGRGSDGFGGDAVIHFNINLNDLTAMAEDPITGNSSQSTRPLYIGFAHELIHGDRTMRGVRYELDQFDTYEYQWARSQTLNSDGTYSDWTYYVHETEHKKEEIGTVGIKRYNEEDITENDIRAEHGLPRRSSYSDGHPFLGQENNTRPSSWKRSHNAIRRMRK